MTHPAGHHRFVTALLAVAAFTLLCARPAMADTCTDLSSLVLPEVTSMTASFVPASTFSPPPPHHGHG